MAKPTFVAVYAKPLVTAEKGPLARLFRNPEGRRCKAEKFSCGRPHCTGH